MAARPASARASMGVVPAWLKAPWMSRRCRSMPTMPSTIARSSPAFSIRGPCSIWSSRYASMSRMWSPTHRAVEPTRPPGELGEAPSSSQKLTISSVSAAGCPVSCRVRSTSSAAITPYAPSSRPPAGTVSECDPDSSHGPLPSRVRPKTLPASSRQAWSPASSMRLASQARAARSAGDPATRSTPPSGRAPKVARVARSSSSRSDEIRPG